MSAFRMDANFANRPISDIHWVVWLGLMKFPDVDTAKVQAALFC